MEIPTPRILAKLTGKTFEYTWHVNKVLSSTTEHDSLGQVRGRSITIVVRITEPKR